MNSLTPSTRHSLIDEPLWLLVQLNGKNHCFEFPPNVHKAIVIGSSDSADVKIQWRPLLRSFLNALVKTFG